MAKLIERPTRIQAAGNKPKEIAEYIGRVNSGTEAVSIVRIPANLSAHSGRTRARVPVTRAPIGATRRVHPVGAKRRMDDQFFSVFSVVASFPSFIPFRLRMDGPLSDRT
jgi:hypothetical protein